MFFTRCWFYLLGLLPAQGRFSRRLRVGLGYYDCRDKIIALDRAELEKLDWRFRFQQDSFRLVAAREKARAAGIGPMDPKYPSIEDFHEIDWRAESVRRNALMP